EDALEIRRRIFNAFEEAEKSEDPDRQRELLTFVIVGGGATGVELAGALGELAHSTLKNDFRNINPTQARILLIEGGERILPGFNPGLSVKAEKALRKLGVSILTRTQLVEIDGDTVHLHSPGEDSEIRAATVLWAAGVKANVLGEKLAAKTGAATDKSGRIIVTEYLTVPGYENIFVVGDMAHFAHQTGEPLPGVAPVAMQEGRYVASMIKRKLSGKPLKPFQYLDRGSMAVIGRNSAIAQFKKWKIGGWFAWITWLFVHIAYLIEFDNKLLVLIQWAYNYFTRKRGARLITTEKERCHQIESRNE
ncbi:MAG: NAD(P)/FAD-dependent oxidoreductase, partial [Calditrichaeota bacterium]